MQHRHKGNTVLWNNVEIEIHLNRFMLMAGGEYIYITENSNDFQYNLLTNCVTTEANHLLPLSLKGGNWLRGWSD